MSKQQIGMMMMMMIIIERMREKSKELYVELIKYIFVNKNQPEIFYSRVLSKN